MTVTMPKTQRLATGRRSYETSTLTAGSAPPDHRAVQVAPHEPAAHSYQPSRQPSPAGATRSGLDSCPHSGHDMGSTQEGVARHGRPGNGRPVRPRFARYYVRSIPARCERCRDGHGGYPGAGPAVVSWPAARAARHAGAGQLILGIPEAARSAATPSTMRSCFSSKAWALPASWSIALSSSCGGPGCGSWRVVRLPSGLYRDMGPTLPRYEFSPGGLFQARARKFSPLSLTVSSLAPFGLACVVCL